MKHRFETVKAKHIARQHGVSVEALKNDAENQQHIARSHHSDVEAASMSPHLSMHSTRGQEAGRGMHGRRGKFQQVISFSLSYVWFHLLLVFLSNRPSLCRVRMAHRSCPLMKPHRSSIHMSYTTPFQRSRLFAREFFMRILVRIF